MARTVIFFTRRAALGAILAMALSGCASPAEERAQADFGRALHEDIVAQIANPELETAPRPPTPADGARAGLAMERYRTGKVIKPQPATASHIGVFMDAGPAASSGE